IAACYGYQSVNGKNQLAIIHRISSDATKEQNKQYIRHGGVRALGMVFAQFIARSEVVKNQKDVNTALRDADVDRNVAKLKKELATRFVFDIVKDEDKKYSLATFNPILGSNHDLETLIKNHKDTS